jgi:N-acetylmuramoyl-L-alanine amidase
MMSSKRVAVAAQALILLGLGLALAAGGSPVRAAPVGYVEGSLPGSTGGSFASFAFAYPGDGSPAELALWISTADPNVLQATGLTVYGPTAGKTYAKTEAGGAQRRTVGFSSTEPGQYVVQVSSYSPVPVGFSVAASHPFAGGGGGGRAIVIDPGHGGPEIGAASPNGDLQEKNVNLKIAQKLAALLQRDGYRVVLTRDSDRSVSPGFRGGTENDLQARVDAANAANANLFVCIHNNGGPAGESGTEVWYNRGRPFSDRNLTLAKMVQAHLVGEIRALGYPARDRGIKDDARFRVVGGKVYNLYVLGPGTPPMPHTPTQMPGVLGESLFLSNPGDVAMLRQERTLDAIAKGYHDAIAEYFKAYP